MKPSFVREISSGVTQFPAPCSTEPPAWLAENAVLITRVAAVSISSVLVEIRRNNLPRLTTLDLKTRLDVEMVVRAFRIPEGVNISEADRLTVASWLRVFAEEIIEARNEATAKLDREAREKLEREAALNRKVATVAETSVYEAERLRAEAAENEKWTAFARDLDAFREWQTRQRDKALREMRARPQAIIPSGATQLHPDAPNVRSLNGR